MSRDHQLVRVRIPPDILTCLKESSEKNHRSFNSEVVFGLEQYLNSIEATKKASDQPASNPDASQK